MAPNKITLDPATTATLDRAPDGTELCDSAGRILGVILSPDAYKRMRDAWEQLVYDEDVAKKCEEDYRAGRTKTTAEVLEYLKRL